MTGWDFILGYMLPMLPMAFMQGVCCFLVGALLGLKLTVNILLAALFVVPVSLFFIAMGLLLGSFLNQKQVGGICGALLTNLTAWFSGIWFDLELAGGTFKKIADLLPFVHGVKLEQAVAAGDLAAALPHLPWVLGYGLAALVLAVFVFFKKMRI